MKKSYLILVIILSLVVVAIFAYLFLKPESENVTEETPQEKIQKAVLDNTSGGDFKVTHVDNDFARGEINEEDTLKDVYLAYLGENWEIVQISEDPISCEKATKMGFPNSMVDDCLYQSPNAKTPREINSSNKEEILEQGGLEIIGDINFGDDPFGNSFVVRDDSGESVSVNLGDYDASNSQNIDDNDYVVVEVDVVEDEAGEIGYVVEDIEEISDGGNSGDETTIISDTDDSSEDEEGLDEIYYDIENIPPGEISDELYELLIDRDSSDQEVQIISDF